MNIICDLSYNECEDFINSLSTIKTNIDISDIVFMIQIIRELLANRFDVVDTTSENYRYTGLCDHAYLIFKYIIKMHNQMYDTSYNVIFFHGELKHSPRISVTYWCMQHTWIGICLEKEIIYVDPTLEQFKDILNNIPDYYISICKPPWFYDDRKNPRFNGITKYIDNRIKIPCKKYYPGIVEFLQYYIWGNICKFYQLIYSRKERIDIS